MSDTEMLRVGVMLAILLIAAIRPKWIFPYLVRFGMVAICVVCSLWLLAVLMGVR